MTSLDEIVGSKWFLPACISVALLVINSVLLYVFKDRGSSRKKAGVTVDTDGGTKFVEDDSGNVVRRSSRVRKSVAGNVDYATLNTGTPTRQRRAAKEAGTPPVVANGTPTPEVEPASPPASPKVSTRRRIKA